MIKIQKNVKSTKVQKNSPAPVAISTKKQNRAKQQKYKAEKYKNLKTQNMQIIKKCKKHKKYKNKKLSGASN